MVASIVLATGAFVPVIAPHVVVTYAVTGTVQ
jgi:hypothetical protein